MNMDFLTDELVGSILKILVGGVFIFTIIAGLKNIPGFGGLFVKHEWLGTWVNGILSFLGGLTLCLTMDRAEAGGMSFIMCVLTSIGGFIGLFTTSAAVHNLHKTHARTPETVALRPMREQAVKMGKLPKTA